MKDIFEGAGAPLDQGGFDTALNRIGGDKEALWSILQVETRGFGFFADRRPKILYERHIFHRRTGGQFDAVAPDLSNKQPGGYASGANEYTRLKRAMLLDRNAALESVSWGLGQVMGFNAVKIGYAGAQAMIAAFAVDEAAQLMGCVRFIEATPALKAAYLARRWEKVALFYNGENYAINAYDTKLATAYQTLRSKGCPSLDVRAAQAYLSYLGYDPKGIDGDAGNNTATAMLAFRKAYRPGSADPQLPDATGASAAAVAAHLGCLKAAFAQKFA
ncbi:hypothetical protein CDL60_18975 [Roseateles noduli]|nr:hypothetical protein CDL60_18975 [Roseateles noduli]